MKCAKGSAAGRKCSILVGIHFSMVDQCLFTNLQCPKLINISMENPTRKHLLGSTYCLPFPAMNTSERRHRTYQPEWTGCPRPDHVQSPQNSRSLGYIAGRYLSASIPGLACSSSLVFAANPPLKYGCHRCGGSCLRSTRHKS